MLGSVKCPHCDLGIHESLLRGNGVLALPNGHVWTIQGQLCPECKQPIVYLESQKPLTHGQFSTPVPRFLAYPRKSKPRPLAPEVPEPYRKYFDDAVAVLDQSPMASAALSRRNLQAVLRDKAGAKKRDLADQIDEIVGSGALPSHINESLHAVRVIGNFAAHPMKSASTGEIVEVEAGEAEWDLDVLESLFDFYFVQPALTAKRKAELNKKLKDAGKPEIK